MTGAFRCNDCGNVYDESPVIVGVADIWPERYKEGDHVPDVACYVCATCADKIRRRNGLDIIV